jgi:hypothetical protein
MKTHEPRYLETVFIAIMIFTVSTMGIMFLKMLHILGN